MSVQVERLQQKLQIMTEMYQENELKLHRYKYHKVYVEHIKNNDE